MVSALLVVSALLADVVSRETLAPPDLAAYEAADKAAGRAPEAHVKLALWCEAHGLQAERMKHLAIAVLTDPANATARGLMGLVAYRGRWQRPDAVGDKVKADAELGATLAEYNARRDGAAPTAEDQWRLALWCEEKGLKAEASAHLANVVRLDPTREAAWKRLGCKRVNGRWMTDAQVTAQKDEAEAQRQADKKWRPLLTKWRGWLETKAHRTQAEQALSEVTDPRAVPSVWAVFAAGDAHLQAVAVRVLGQIDSPSASRALAFLSIGGRSVEVRRVATETLAGRDPREFANLLIALLRDPIKYEVRPVGGPGSPGVLFVQGERFNVQRLYSPPPMPRVAVFPGDSMGYDAYGLPVLHHQGQRAFSTGRLTGQQILQSMPVYGSASSSPFGGKLDGLKRFGIDPTTVARDFAPTALQTQLMQSIQHVAKAEHKKPSQFGFGLNFVESVDVQVPVGQMMLEAEKTAVVAQAQLQSDLNAIRSYNSDVEDGNDRVAAVLDKTTGQDLGKDRKAWKGWWTNQLGYAYRTPEETPVPTIVENVPLAYQPQTDPVTTTVSPPILSGFRRMSCFGAGTLVRTLEGVRAIETLKVGDQVLTQELKTGGLGYHPILVVHHNPPSPTFLIETAGETIVSSPFHRFWKAGQGWVMARDLKAGDTLRMLDGLSRVESMKSGPVQKVYNLDVAEDHDFFAGQRGALVHDNTLPDLRQTPFDLAATLPTLSASSGSPHD